MTNARRDKLAHPCRDTCSGWKQGYDAGRADERAEAQKLVRAITRYLNIKMNPSDYSNGIQKNENILRNALAEWEGK